MDIGRKKYIAMVAERLREVGARKPVSVPKHTFRISDEDGNFSEFTVKQEDRNAVYTKDDVATIITACEEIIMDCIRTGNGVNFTGFGAFRVKKHKGQTLKDYRSGEKRQIDDYYLPKFAPGKNLKMAAKTYSLYLADHPEEAETDEREEDEEDEVEYAVQETEGGDQYCLWR